MTIRFDNIKGLCGSNPRYYMECARIANAFFC